MNVVVLSGHLSRPAQQRELPSGDLLVALDLTVRDGSPRAESVPVVLFQAPARAATLDTDDEVVVIGRVRRRFFRTGEATQSRTEVVAESVFRATERKRVAAAMQAAARRVSGAAEPV